MRKNKRFILLVVAVLLANCLFAGLASAAEVKGKTTQTKFSTPVDVTFYYDVTEMNPYGALYSARNIYLNLYHWNGAGEYGITMEGDGWIDVYFQAAETPNLFEVTSSDPSVVSVPSYNIQANKLYVDDVGDGAGLTLTAYKAGTAIITIQEGYWNANGNFIPKGSSTSVKMTINKNTAEAITLVQKPIAENYKVGAKITAALAPYKIDEMTLYYAPSNFGTNDIMAFIWGRGYHEYASSYTDYTKVPATYTIYEGPFATKTEAEAWLKANKQSIDKSLRSYAVVDQQADRTYVVLVPETWQTIAVTQTPVEYYWKGWVNQRFTDLGWSVSPADAATVTVANDVATFQFLKAGKVTITAYMKDDPTIKTSVTYTIDKNPDLPVEEGKLVNADGKTSATVKLSKGVAPETFTLKAKDANVEIVKFKSSKTSVATIDEKTGVVTIVKDKEGTVQFTGYDKNGNAYTFNLKVKKVPVSKLTVEKKSLTVEAGKTAQIAWATKPAYAYNPAVKFTSSDKKVATVSVTGLVTGVKAGKTTVVVTPKFAKDTVNPVTIKVTVK